MSSSFSLDAGTAAKYIQAADKNGDGKMSKQEAQDRLDELKKAGKSSDDPEGMFLQTIISGDGGKGYFDQIAGLDGDSSTISVDDITKLAAKSGDKNKIEADDLKATKGKDINSALNTAAGQDTQSPYAGTLSLGNQTPSGVTPQVQIAAPAQTPKVVYNPPQPMASSSTAFSGVIPQAQGVSTTNNSPVKPLVYSPNQYSGQPLSLMNNPLLGQKLGQTTNNIPTGTLPAYGTGVGTTSAQPTNNGAKVIPIQIVIPNNAGGSVTSASPTASNQQPVAANNTDQKQAFINFIQALKAAFGLGTQNNTGTNVAGVTPQVAGVTPQAAGATPTASNQQLTTNSNDQQQKLKQMIQGFMMAFMMIAQFLQPNSNTQQTTAK